MLYCPKCRSLCPDGALKCPACRGGKLRPAGAGDWVLLLTAGLYTAQRLEERLKEEGIGCKWEELGWSAESFYDSQAMPTDRRIYVRYGDLAAAREAAAGVEVLEEEGEKVEAEPPGVRRLAGEIGAIVVFLAVVMLAVFGADAVAGWLKSLF